MKLTTLSGKIISLDLRQQDYPLRLEADCRSKSQFRLGKLLCELFNKANIFEEFKLPEEKLFLDFFIPSRQLAFEFDGQQHLAYNKFFHGLRINFDRQKELDQRKEEWCKLNLITLVRVKNPKISLDELKSLIIQCRRQEI